MTAPHLLVWFESDNARACPLGEVPEALIYKGQIYRSESNYFGDVDYLRGEKNQLVGFAYYPGDEWSLAVQKKLLAQSSCVKLDDGILVLSLKPCAYEIESVAAMGTEIYRATNDDLILSVPNWGFGGLAFELLTESVPVALPQFSG